MALLNFQPIQYISPTQAASAATFARPIKANFEALASTNALSGSALIGVSLSPTNYSQTGNSVFDHLTGINTKFGTLNAVTLTASATPSNYTKITSSIEGHLKGIDTALGTKQGTLTNSAGLAAALSDETGTGVAVFNVAPTIQSASMTETTTVSALIVTTQAYYSSEYDNGNSSTAKTINWTLGNMQKVTLTGNCTFTFTAPTGYAPLMLRCIADGNVRTITWPTTVKWANGVAPTMTGTVSKWDILTFLWNGTNYSGVYNQLFG